ncbi:ABC transporter permease [Pseudomonas borbori]|uniref:ABC-type transport system involved in multi-copper enzyme maturation, permease component n=1 Tax=Pseudomonas borbori TaxID=289003 RepID=A0A1I5TVM2_9PSED|nr:ABC transporter permease [Pseudomonas borbori]SFP87094.1 ABC-type transport system involved in multi-copper enzyme maturation, permease component [Pseudomonas borbori]
MPIFRDFLTALRLALKAKFAWMAAGVLLVVALATGLSAYFGGRQPATVALDVGVSTMRLLVPLLIVLLVQELLSREFDKRYYLNSLTYPRGRRSLLLGRFAALLAMLLGLLLALGLLQIGLVQFIGGIYPQATPVAMGQPYLIVMAFMALDLLVLAALATLLAVVASTPSFVLIGTFGFMLVARSYGAIVELLSSNAGVVVNAEGYRASLGVLGYLLPDLGALDLRMLALYGKPEFLPADWPWLLLSSLAYAFALMALAVWALQRKRFA